MAKPSLARRVFDPGYMPEWWYFTSIVLTDVAVLGFLFWAFPIG